jgi:hypothetical protein
MRRLTVAVVLAFIVAVVFASSASHRHGRSPHVEITAVARVETTPQRIRHANGRDFEELDVRILSEQHAAGGPSVDTEKPVRVVHDLTCGGDWLETKAGDRVEIKGEYVHPPRGGDLIHFTHRANAGVCGSGEHADGYLRMAPPQTETAADAAGDLFRTSIRPVVARRCLCHEKGGRMYERLPFDNPSVLSSHAVGVRRRLRGDDLEAFEKWMATVAASPGS